MHAYLPAFAISRSLGLLKLVVVLWVLIVQSVSADGSYSGSWYNPARDGEGFHIEIQDNNQALVIWFTYPGVSDNAETEQAWILGTGTISEDTITINDAFKGRGPEFGENYNTDDFVTETWGDITITFSDDNNGHIDYDGGDGSGSMPITRVTAIVDAEDAGGLPNGISGAWYNEETNGQGWFVEIISKTSALVYWFSYDENGNQAWNLGVGDILGHSIVLRDSQTGKNTKFGDEFQAGDVNRESFAAFTLTFTDCNAGSITYVTVSGEHIGTLPITRLTRLVDTECDDLPKPEDGQMAVMSNPSDPALRRYTSPGGIVSELLGQANEQGVIQSADGGVAILPNGETVRVRISADEGRYELVDSETGIIFTLLEDENGNRSLTATEPTTGGSVTVPLPKNSEASTQSDIPSQKRKDPTSSIEVIGDIGPGGGDGSYKTGSVAVNLCSTSQTTNKASVDFSIENPNQSQADIYKVVPAYPRLLPDESWIYEGNLPRDLPEVHDSITDFLCTATHLDIDAFCKTLEFHRITLTPQVVGACATLSAAMASTVVLAPFAAATLTACAGALVAVEGFCLADDIRTEMCNAPDYVKFWTPWDGRVLDAWASATLSADQVAHSGSIGLAPGLNQYTFPNIDFKQPQSILKHVTYPTNPVEGSFYQLDVQTNCMDAGTGLVFKRNNKPDVECTVNGAGQCLFTIDTTMGTTTDVGEIHGPSGIKKPVVTNLVPFADTAPLPLISPTEDSTVANKCGDDDPVWKFEWSPVVGANSYTVRLLDGDGNEVFKEQTSGTEYSYTLTEAIAEDKRDDWLWSVWADPDAVADAEFDVKSCNIDLTGQWLLEMVDISNNCEDGNGTSSVVVSVTQTGSNLEVCDPELGCIPGTIQGSNITWNGSYPENGGTSTASFGMTLSEDGNVLSGTNNWSWSHRTFSCSGTTNVTASRL